MKIYVIKVKNGCTLREWIVVAPDLDAAREEVAKKSDAAPLIQPGGKHTEVFVIYNVREDADPGIIYSSVEVLAHPEAQDHGIDYSHKHGID